MLTVHSADSCAGPKILMRPPGKYSPQTSLDSEAESGRKSVGCPVSLTDERGCGRKGDFKCLTFSD